MTAISTNSVRTAAQELERMRRSLRGWLKFRAMNDQVLAGTAHVRKPVAYAQRVVMSARDPQIEQDLADKLHALLTTVLPDAQLPSSDLHEDPMAAVKLAQIAITGKAPLASPAAAGNVAAAHPWLWPVLIVGGLLLAVTTAIKTAADVAKDREEKACIEAGACTDYGFWLKAGGVAMLVWFAWRELGVGDIARKALKKGGG